MESLQDFIVSVTLFISNVLIPALFSLALLFFIWNVFRFFILGKNNEPDKESARQLAIYSVAAFVFLVSLWGIVHLVVNGLNLNSDSYVTPDFIQEWGGENNGAQCEGGRICIPDPYTPGTTVCFAC